MALLGYICPAVGKVSLWMLYRFEVSAHVLVLSDSRYIYLHFYGLLMTTLLILKWILMVCAEWR